MDMQQKLRFIESGVIAVIRKCDPESILPLAHALLQGGVIALEITMESPGSLEMIESLRNEFNDEVIVGAGTVLDGETAKMAIAAGAEFILSPSINQQMIEVTKRYGKLCVPGAMTPTEILTAYEKGADMVKVFPAGSLGPNYLKDVKGPLGHIPLIPTGGVGLENVAEFIKAGAIAVGVGGSLIDRDSIKNRDFTMIKERARKFMEKVQIAKENEKRK